MAKELAMVERNAMGKLARNYFIKCEELATEILPKMADELLACRPLWREIKRYKELGLNNREVGRLLLKSKDTIRHNLRRMESVGLLQPPADLKRRQEIAGQAFGEKKQLPLFC